MYTEEALCRVRLTPKKVCPISREVCLGKKCAFATGRMVPTKDADVPPDLGDMVHGYDPERFVGMESAWFCSMAHALVIVEAWALQWRSVPRDDEGGEAFGWQRVC